MDDRDLHRRSRAYESRLPQTDAPDPRGIRQSSGLRWPALAAVLGAAAIVGVLAGLVLLNRPSRPIGELPPTASSPASASPTPEPATMAPSASPTGSPTTEPEPAASPASKLEWTQTASFGSPEGMTIANDVIEGSMGIVAIGTEYTSRLPNLGPTPPHAGRVWLSADGQQWEDVTPADIFGNTSLHDVILAADGSLIAFGAVSAATEYGLTPSGEAAWSSVDGRTWTPLETGLPKPMALSISQGGHGYLAHLVEFGATHGSELWFSEDGRSWKHVRTLRDGQKSVGAGPEGFVVVGSDGVYGDVKPFAVASGDGREWFESAQPPDDAWLVTPRGGDWLAIAAGFAASGASTEAQTWSSSNGLDWVEAAGIPLGDASADSSLVCPEYVRSVSSAEVWTIVGTQLGGGCGEGGFYVNGTQLISADGTTWQPLPFDIGSPGDQASGALVHGAVMIDGSVALVGEADRQAVFWLGSPR